MKNIITKPIKTSQKRLSDKYRGILSKKQGEELNEHIKQMRDEWDIEALSLRT
jgi:hypothetical protein